MFGFGRLAAGADKGSDNECPVTSAVHRRGRGTFHRPDEDRTLHWEHLDTMPLKLTDIKISPTAAGSEWLKDRVMIGEEEVDKVRLPPVSKPKKKQQQQPAQSKKKRNGKDGGAAAIEAVARPALSSSVASDEPESTSSKRRRRKKSAKASLDGATEQPQLLQTPQKLSKAVAAPPKTNVVFSFKAASLSTQQKTSSAALKPELLAPTKLGEAAPKAAIVDHQTSLMAPETENTAEIRETETLAPTFKLAGLFSRKTETTAEQKRAKAEVSAVASLNADGFFVCNTETAEKKREVPAPTPKHYGIFAPKMETNNDKREGAEPVPATPRPYGIFAPKTETTNDKREAAEPAPATLKTYGIFAPKTETTEKREEQPSLASPELVSTAEIREVKPSLAVLEKAGKTAEPVVAQQAELELFGVPPVEPVKPVVSGWAATFLRAMEKANVGKATEPAPRAEEAMRRVERV